MESAKCQPSFETAVCYINIISDKNVLQTSEIWNWLDD